MVACRRSMIVSDHSCVPLFRSLLLFGPLDSSPWPTPCVLLFDASPYPCTVLCLFPCCVAWQANAQSAREASLKATLRERTEKLAAVEAEKAPPVVAGGKVSSGDPVQDWIDSLE